MKFASFASLFAVPMLLAGFALPAQAASKADVYLGYSRVGANLYGPNTAAMNGWQAAAQVKVVPFVGVEGDFSHYSQASNGFSEGATLVMFGPRVTVGGLGFSVFAHALGGIAHVNQTVTTFRSSSYNAASYALGVGADVPIFLGLKLRVTGDYLGNSNEPSAAASGGAGPSHYRIGAGLAYHF